MPKYLMTGFGEQVGCDPPAPAVRDAARIYLTALDSTQRVMAERRDSAQRDPPSVEDRQRDLSGYVICMSNQLKNDAGLTRLQWLKALKEGAIDGIERVEAGLHLLSAEGDEHLRDAAEAWLDHHREIAIKLERRIQVEEDRLP